MSGLENKEAVELLAESCRILGRLNLTHYASGHVSSRIEGSQSMLIKGKGPDQVGLRYAQPEDIVQVDFNADLLNGREGLRPPSESFLHLWIYKLKSEVNCVIHMHPPHAVLLTICNVPIIPIYGAFDTQGAKLAIEGVRTYGSSITIHDDEKGESFAHFLGDSTAVLMHGHGITVTGTSVEEATGRAIAFNRLATMTYLAHNMGNVQRLPEEDIANYSRPHSPEQRTRGSAGGEEGIQGTYRYLRALSEEPALPPI